MQAEAEKKWRDKLIQEAETLSKTEKLLDNSDIQAKLLECIRLGNALLTSFVERVIGKDREILFKDEIEEINRITALQAIAEQNGHTLANSQVKLQEAKTQLERVKNLVS